MHTANTPFQTLFIALTMIAVAGCGGGGGGAGSPASGGILQPDTRPQPLGTLRTSTLPSVDRVVAYLRETDISWDTRPAGLVRFESPPVVRISEDATDRERALSHYAVSLVNRALPYGHHLVIGGDFEDIPAGRGTRWRERLPGVPDGELFIVWSRELDGCDQCEHAVALAHQDFKTDRLRASAANMNRTYFETQSGHRAVSALIHEILHAMGMQGHVNGDEFPESVMFDAWPRLDGAIPAIDTAALQVLYTVLDPHTDRADLTVDSLGAWEDESMDVTADLRMVDFGVRHANGISVPFTAGPEPSGDLSDSGLAGTVAWSGHLVGFTPGLATVAGDSVVSVDMDTMAGTASFTDMRVFARGTAPMREGETIWGDDGSLAYSIRVGGNYLYSIGGDDGVVSGSFYGDGHGHVGGTVERSDLTAAFGGER